MSDFFYGALLLIIVIAIFNVIIFVHELGHFLAARWRGLQVDRFQIWFGKPIWKKEINGVLYGMGWIPAGGFVALPQMAPMESIEGQNRDDSDPLPKVKPLDKIIVAFAGPLFSLLLAFAAAVVVWQFGKPQDAITNTLIGGIEEGSPADKAGLMPGDRILEIDGEPVEWFTGNFDAVRERIMLTKKDEVSFKVDRNGEEMTIVSEFEIEETAFWQRRALPTVGIHPSGGVVVAALSKSKSPSPAERAGLQKGDELLKINGEKIYGVGHVLSLLKNAGENPVVMEIKRGDEMLAKTITPLVPEGDFYKKPMIGFIPGYKDLFEDKMVYPGPWSQVTDSLMQMWVTISSVASPNSKVGVDQLAGPVGIATMKYKLLLMEDGWYRLLFLLVLFNVNLAVLNMLPFPVLDGGHIVMSLSEMLSGRPMNARFLEVVQTGFALFLMCFLLFITSKDVGALLPGQKGEDPPEEIVWPDAPKTPS